MTLLKQLLHYMLDIGGVCTLNNLYSPNAKKYEDSMRQVRSLKDFWLENKFIVELRPHSKYSTSHPARELFYSITKEGATFIDREEDFKRVKKKSDNPLNIAHESCLNDVLIGIIRSYPEYRVTIEFPTKKLVPNGKKPDAKVTMIHRTNYGLRHTFIVEVERKKTVDRAFHETVKLHLPAAKNGLKVLTVFSNKERYPWFIRPQDMYGDVMDDLVDTIEKTKVLATSPAYGGKLPNNFLFMSQSDFDRPNQQVLLLPNGQPTKLIN